MVDFVVICYGLTMDFMVNNGMIWDSPSGNLTQFASWNITIGKLDDNGLTWVNNGMIMGYTLW